MLLLNLYSPTRWHYWDWLPTLRERCLDLQRLSVQRRSGASSMAHIRCDDFLYRVKNGAFGPAAEPIIGRS